MNYQVMPPLSDEEYLELKSDIQQRGVMVPIEFDEDGNVLDGHHRLQICKELGITVYPKIIRNGMTEEEKRTHARKLNMARRQLNREQKQQLIREQLMETPERSDRQIAGALNASPTTVGTVRKQMETSGQLSKLDSSIGADGKERPRQVERKQVTTSPLRTEVIQNRPQPNLSKPATAPEEFPEWEKSKPKNSERPKAQEKISELQPLPEWDETEAEDDAPLAETVMEEDEKEQPDWSAEPETTPIKVEVVKKPHVVNNSTDNEWYTPARYIELARTAMGSIDLDPASNDFANETVNAETYYTEEMNGLEQEWFGNIWMNPPYQTALLQQFADKLTSSDFNQAIVLVNNATETAWFSQLVSKASAIVFHKGRIRFVKRDGEHGTPLQGQAFIYYGKNPDRFLDVFGECGWGAKL